jgi:peptidoglycan/LPS O-acetylase OafA/YrhL
VAACPPWTYLYRRVVRLYPMFVIGLLLGCVVPDYVAHSGAIVYPAADILRGATVNVFYIPFLNSLPIYSEIGQLFPATRRLGRCPSRYWRAAPSFCCSI